MFASKEQTRRNYELFVMVMQGRSLRSTAKLLDISPARAAQIFAKVKKKVVKECGELENKFGVEGMNGMRMSADKWIHRAKHEFYKRTGEDL